jgi:hypothetical protein
MNLIEQLGGYENARFLVYNCGDLDYIDDFTTDDIRKALLQYRREHNIFEVGDKVAFTTLDSGSDISEYEDWFIDFHDCIRHATPEEIQAGRRLEVYGG